MRTARRRSARQNTLQPRWSAKVRTSTELRTLWYGCAAVFFLGGNLDGPGGPEELEGGTPEPRLATGASSVRPLQRRLELCHKNMKCLKTKKSWGTRG